MHVPKLGDVVATRYELTDELGRGGFGVVFKATQIGMNRPVALKVLLPQAASVDTVAERFVREAQLAKNLVHPHTIQLFDFGETDGGCLYIAMEFLEGETLDALLKREGQLPLDRVGHIATQILKSLAEAHEHGIVHRDLKPANIFLRELVGEKDFVKVLDFGIAKALNLDGVEEEKLTQTGSSFGTPSYMAPEQIRGINIGAHTDLYALALIMIKMLTGQTAVEGGTPIETAALQLSPNPIPLPDWVGHSPVGPVIAKALSKSVDQRYGSAIEMLQDLQRVANAARGSLAEMPTAIYAGGMTPPSGQVMASGQIDYSSMQLSGPVHIPGSGHARKTNVIIPILLGLILLVIGAGVAVYLLRGGEAAHEEKSAEAKTAPAAQGSTAAPVDTVPKTIEVPEIPAEPEVTDPILPTTPTDGPGDTTTPKPPVEVAAAPVVEIPLASTPGGAIVMDGDRFLGTTPVTARFEGDSGVRVLAFSGPGFETTSVEVDLAAPKPVTVTLKQLAGAPENPAADDTTATRRRRRRAADGTASEVTKPAETKPAETKPAETKPAETKPEDRKSIPLPD